jgi:hypothetical protein
VLGLHERPASRSFVHPPKTPNTLQDTSFSPQRQDRSFNRVATWGFAAIRTFS